MGQAKLTIAGDSEKAQQAIVALEKKVDRLQNSLKNVSQRTKRTASESSISWDKAGASVVRYAGRLMSLTAIATTTASVLTDVSNRAKLAGEAVRNSASGLGSLVSIARDQKHLDQLMQQTRNVFNSGAVETKDEAARFVFSMESNSVSQTDQSFLTEMSRLKQLGDDPKAVTDALSTLRDSMGQKETGNFRQLMSKATAATSITKSTVPELLSASAGAGTYASALDISDEETLAAVAIASRAAKSADVGSTQIRSLMQSLDKQGGFKGVPLRDAVQDIMGRNLSGEELQKLLGSSEALTGLRTLSAQDNDYQKLLTKVRTAEATDLVGEKIRMAEAVPEIVTTSVRQSLINKGIENENRVGLINNLADAVAREQQTRADDLGGFVSSLQKFTTTMDRWISGDRGYLNAMQYQGIPSPELNQEILRVLKSIDGKTEKPQPVPPGKLRRNGD